MEFLINGTFLLLVSIVVLTIRVNKIVSLLSEISHKLGNTTTNESKFGNTTTNESEFAISNEAIDKYLQHRKEAQK